MISLYKVGKSLLRYRRIEAGLTQQQLAEKSGRSRQKVSDHESDKGDTMSFEAAYNYAQALDCRMEDLHEWIHVGKRAGRDE